MPPDAPHADTPAPSGNSAHTASQVVAALLVALVLYVLSIGPVLVAFNATGLLSNPTAVQCIIIIYAPLSLLAEQHPPAKKFFSNYIDWCCEVSGQAPFDR